MSNGSDSRVSRAKRVISLSLTLVAAIAMLGDVVEHYNSLFNRDSWRKKRTIWSNTLSRFRAR